MDENNERFESFLREFHPRRPRALPEITNVAPVIRQRLAAAAILIIGLASSAWLLLRAPASKETRFADGRQATAAPTRPGHRPLSTIELTHLALENPAGLDAALAADQENRLPRFDRQNTVLRVLARE